SAFIQHSAWLSGFLRDWMDRFRLILGVLRIGAPSTDGTIRTKQARHCALCETLFVHWWLCCCSLLARLVRQHMNLKQLWFPLLLCTLCLAGAVVLIWTL